MKTIDQILDCIFVNPRQVIKRGRHKVRDISFKYRINTGFAGDVNRVHPVSIEPALISAGANPPTLSGQVVLADGAGGVRAVVAATDGAIASIYGITVRDYPFQNGLVQGNSEESIGTTGLTVKDCSVMRSGYMIVLVNGSPVKGAPVNIWVAASAGAHITGGFEAAATGGSTITLDSRSTFNSPAGADGLCEVAFNI